MGDLYSPDCVPFSASWLEAEGREMDDQEFGVFVRLLLHQWRHGSVPSEPSRARNVAASSEAVWSAVATCFEVGSGDHGRMAHPGLEVVRLREEKAQTAARATSKKRSAAGAAGARARWDRERATSAPASDGPATAGASVAASVDRGGGQALMFPPGDPKDGGESEGAKFQGAIPPQYAKARALPRMLAELPWMPDNVFSPESWEAWLDVLEFLRVTKRKKLSPKSVEVLFDDCRRLNMKPDEFVRMCRTTMRAQWASLWPEKFAGGSVPASRGRSKSRPSKRGQDAGAQAGLIDVSAYRG